MNIPSNCPICRYSLYNEYRIISLPGVKRRIEHLQKTCTKSPSHRLIFNSASYDDDLLEEIILHFPEKSDITQISWSFSHGVTLVSKKMSNSHSCLPLWEPDLSNLPKLLSKIKKYLIFS